MKNETLYQRRTMTRPFNQYIGDNVKVMREHFADNSMDSCVTDGPYGIRMMGKAWDSFDINHVNNQIGDYNERNKRGKNHKALAAGKYERTREANVAFQLWFWERAKEIYRVLKPGGYVVSFGSPRTFHRMVCAFEDAGFEIRDTLMWVFAGGFPKSKNMPEDSEWAGWGSALKPAYEPILLARKPLDQNNILTNLRVHGVGGLNIDASRIPFISLEDYEAGTFGNQPKLNGGRYIPGQITPKERHAENIAANPLGRWPANFLHDGSDEVLKLFPKTKSGAGNYTNETATGYKGNTYSSHVREKGSVNVSYGDEGSAARFFYCPKISPEDRNEGLPDGMANEHPTVKPTELMRYLVRLVTPQDGKVLDPFAGSGSTGKASIFELCEPYLIDEDPQWLQVQRYRMEFALKNRTGQYSLL